MPGEAHHQALLLARLAEAGEPLTLDALASMVSEGPLTLTAREASKAAGRLVVRGLVERLERGVFVATAAGQAARASGKPLTSGPRGKRGRPTLGRSDSMRQRAWTAMRVMRRFTVADLAVAARRSGEPDPSGNLGLYAGALCRADILALSPFRHDDGVPCSNGLKVYRLVRDLGPAAPHWRRDRGEIYVPESGEVLPCSSTP